MSDSKTANIKTQNSKGFVASRIGGNTGPDVSDLYSNTKTDFPVEPEIIPVHGLFVDALTRPCPLGDLCGKVSVFDLPGNDPENWESPDNPPEATLHFNTYQTAMLHTLCIGIARLTGKPELKESRINSILEMGRLFLRTSAIVDSGFWQEWRARIDRGKTNRADWVTVQDNATPPDEQTSQTPPDSQGVDMDNPTVSDNPNIKVDVHPVGDDDSLSVNIREEMTGDSSIDENAGELYNATDNGTLYNDQE